MQDLSPDCILPTTHCQENCRVSDDKKGGNTLNKEEKIRIIAEFQDKFAKAAGVIFTDYKGLTVKEMSDLRSQLMSSSLEYRVVKNTLARRASEGTPVEMAKDAFTGTVGVAISYDDPVILAKKILGFAKTNDKFKVKAGIIEGKVCGAEDIKTVSELPSRETLLAMFIGAMQSPLSKFASGLHATLTQFIYAVEALKNKKQLES